MAGLPVDSETTIARSGDALWHDLRIKLEGFLAQRVDRDDVDDVVQETMIRIYRGLPSLRDNQLLGPWMYRVARNAATDHLRAQGRRLEEPSDLGHGVEPLTTVEGEEVDDFDAKALAAYASWWVKTVQEPYTEALTLVDLQGLTHRQAAEIVGVPVPTMKSRVQRGRRYVRNAIEECCEITLDRRNGVVEARPKPFRKAVRLLAHP